MPGILKKMNTREKVLLVVMLVLLTGVLYYLLFFIPMEDNMAEVATLQEDTSTEITASQLRVKKMNDMQAELDQIFAAAGGKPTELSQYDNFETVIKQFNSILTAAADYSLTFQPVAASEDGIIRRPIQLVFSCGSYETAKSILTQLSDNDYRCQISNLTLTGSSGTQAYVSVDQGTSGSYNVSALLTYFEYAR